MPQLKVFNLLRHLAPNLSTSLKWTEVPTEQVGLSGKCGVKLKKKYYCLLIALITTSGSDVNVSCFRD